MAIKQNYLKDPTEVINSTLDEISFKAIKKLATINLRKLSGSRTIDYGGTTYNIIIDIKISKV